MNRENLKRRFYADGLHFECTGCGDCCTFSDGVVFISPLEIDIVAQHLNISYKECVEKYINESQGRTVLKDKDDACIFFKDKKCTIYDVRPMQCRTFPFWSTNLKSQYRWKTVGEKGVGIGHGRLFTYEEIQTIKDDLDETPAGPSINE